MRVVNSAFRPSGVGDPLQVVLGHQPLDVVVVDVGARRNRTERHLPYGVMHCQQIQVNTHA